MNDIERTGHEFAQINLSLRRTYPIDNAGHPEVGMFNRQPSQHAELINQWEGGFGWFAHPEEGGMRASHAFVFDNVVWIVDPIDAPGIDARIDELGEVAGVAICSSFHTRDAETFARRYDVPLFIPTRMPSVGKRVTGEIVRYPDDLPESGVRAIHRKVAPGFLETILYHEASATLYIPDTLGTAPYYLVGDERLGAPLLARLLPPRELLSLDPARICVGHGVGVFEQPTDALSDAIRNSRRRFPRALYTHFGTGVRTAVATLRG